MKKDTISVPSGLRRSGSSQQDGTAEGPAAKKQAKLSSFFQKNVTQPIAAASDAPAPASASTATSVQQVSKVLKVSYDFEDENRCHHGEGRTITVEFDSFILVACYVPNSGEGLRRLDYRIDEW